MLRRRLPQHRRSGGRRRGRCRAGPRGAAARPRRRGRAAAPARRRPNHPYPARTRAAQVRARHRLRRSRRRLPRRAERSHRMSTATVPVVIIGAGPTGLTAATLLGQYGVECLVLDRWESIYPQPRAVHLDDEIYRILARMGLREEFAAISRPLEGLRLVDRNMRMLGEFRRGTAEGKHGYPEANMYDQPELEALLRANLTDVTQDGAGPVLVDVTDRPTGVEETVTAEYVLGCDGANSLVRGVIGASMHDLNFEQRWLVVDVATDANLGQWEGAHQVCGPVRAATYMRIGPTRYRWEFRLAAGETAEDYRDIALLHPLLAPWTGNLPVDRLEIGRVAEYTFRAQVADHWRDRRVFLLGDAAHLTPPFIGQGLCA